MKLKEFSLWGYKLERSESRKFTLENRCVCAHFERHLEGVETEGVFRVIVKLSEGDIRDGTTELSSSVLKYYDKFDFKFFYSCSEHKRKEILLEQLFTALLKVCELYRWPIEPFERARSKVIEDNFQNSYVLSRKLNQSRKLKASLIAEHCSTQFSLAIVVTDLANREVFRRQVLVEDPDEFLFNCQIGSIRWMNSELLRYSFRDKGAAKAFEFGIHAGSL